MGDGKMICWGRTRVQDKGGEAALFHGAQKQTALCPVLDLVLVTKVLRTAVDFEPSARDHAVLYFTDVILLEYEVAWRRT